MRTVVLACVLHLGVASAALAVGRFAEPPLTPAEPIAGQSIVAHILDPAACADLYPTVERIGTVIDIRFEEINCPVLPIGAAADVALGALPEGTYDLRLFEVSDPAHPRRDDEMVFTVGPAACSGVCLLANRFTVIAEWRTTHGESGSGHPVSTSDTTGAFWFFSADNVELMVKSLDACTAFGRYWFFAAGLTDVGVTLHVHDNVTGADRTYENPVGRPFEPITDTDAFPCP